MNVSRDDIKTAIGLMSGTSMDGIDVALIKTDGLGHIDLGSSASYPYTAFETQALSSGLEDAKTIASRHERPGRLAQLEAAVTVRHAQAVIDFLTANKLEAKDIDVIGFHGQTVLHRPEMGVTVQLGDGALLAQKTGIDVVYDMRANDMRNGGQGAPLVSVFHSALIRSRFENSPEPVAVVNIGGIANVTFIQPGLPPIAFDCGPGNALIDQWMQKHTNQQFDDGGALALSGKADLLVAQRYMADTFFEKTYPKSLDRNDFTLSGMSDLDAAAGAATLALVSAMGIAQSAELANLKPARWIISGGGSHNRAIMQALTKALPDAQVITAEQAGFSSDAMEAQAWAYLAVRSLRGLALTFPTTTGCAEPVTGGLLARKA